MSKKELLLLVILRKEDAVDRVKALTIDQCMDEEDELSEANHNTIYKIFVRMQKNGYVARGLSDENAHSYYITKKGLDTIESFEV
jgi:DNA-binding PadR family transcriptional regulator